MDIPQNIGLMELCGLIFDMKIRVSPTCEIEK